MTDDLDIRVKTGFLRHPKTQRLCRIIGEDAPQRLIQLWCFCRLNRPDGVLTYMDNISIAIAADYSGDPDQFINTLVDERWLDLHDMHGTYQVHDWEEHQGWSSGAERRKAAARYAALVKNHSQAYADRVMPGWREHKITTRPAPAPPIKPAGAQKGTTRPAPAPLSVTKGSAPSPSPSFPSPSPKYREASCTMKSRTQVDEEKASCTMKTTSNQDKKTPPMAVLVAVIDDLNEVTGRTDSQHKFKRVGSTIKLIRDRMVIDGATVDDFKHVHRVQWAKWQGRKSSDGVPMTDFMRPKTLYNPTNFEQYRASSMPQDISSGDQFGKSGKVAV